MCLLGRSWVGSVKLSDTVAKENGTWPDADGVTLPIAKSGVKWRHLLTPSLLLQSPASGLGKHLQTGWTEPLLSILKLREPESITFHFYLKFLIVVKYTQ
jgi:hypothetical protein